VGGCCACCYIIAGAAACQWSRSCPSVQWCQALWANRRSSRRGSGGGSNSSLPGGGSRRSSLLHCCWRWCLPVQQERFFVSPVPGSVVQPAVLLLVLVILV
jgi:hypothetical protein